MNNKVRSDKRNSDDQIAALESPEDFFKRRAEGAEKINFLEILRNVPNRAPYPGDELQ